MEKLANANDYCLIDGEFSADEARRVLMTLINDKIKFHQMNELSHEERYGEENPASSRRIEELSQTRDALTQLIDAAETQGLRLKINSRIDIELTPSLVHFDHMAKNADPNKIKHLT